MDYCVCVLSHFSCVLLFTTLWTVARQASLSVGFFRQEYWSGLPFPTPGDLPDPRIKPTSPESPALQADSLPLALLGKPKPFFTSPFFYLVSFFHAVNEVQHSLILYIF